LRQIERQGDVAEKKLNIILTNMSYCRFNF
jgi:hypothetical protein